MALAELDLSDTAEECMDNCVEAMQAGERCAGGCLDEDVARCIRLCRDVADPTTERARFMARNSTYSEDLAATCAAACEEREECARHDHCQVCADVLEDCARTCREMAA